VGFKNDGDFTITNYLNLTDQHSGSSVEQVPFSVGNSGPHTLRGRDKPCNSFSGFEMSGPEPPPPQPTSFWSMDDVDLVGSVVLDLAGANDGILSGTVTTGAVGQIEEAFIFPTGSLGYVTFGDVLDQTTGSFSVSAWFSYDGIGSGQNSSLVNKGGSSVGTPPNAGYSLQLSEPANNIRFVLVDATTTVIAAAPSLPSTGAFHQAVGVCDRENDEVRFYLDGALQEITAIPGGFGSITTNLHFSLAGQDLSPTATPPQGFLTGSQDETGYWDGIALSDSDVLKIYTLGTNGQKLVS